METREFSIGFPQYWLILKRHWLPASMVFGAALALTALSISLQKPVYQAEAKLSFKKISPTSSLTGLGKEIGQFAPVGEQSNPLNTEIEIIRSIPIAQKIITKFNLKDKNDTPLKVKQFLNQLSVVNTRGTDILSVSYQDRDPQRAAAIVNTLIALYTENNQIVSRAEAVSARVFIEKQLPKAQGSVEQAEAALRRFKEQNKVLALQEEAKSAVEVISDLDRKIVQAESELADLNAQTQAFQNELQMNAQQGLVTTSLSQSSTVQEALKEYQQVERQLAVERTRFLEEHPMIVNLKLKEASLKALLQQQVQQVVGSEKRLSNGTLQIGEVKPRLIEEFVKIKAKRAGLVKQVSALSTLKADYQQRVNVLPKLEQEEHQLENQLQASRTTYLLLLQKLQEIGITENQNLGNARIIADATVPQEPIASRKSLILVSGVLLGSLLAIATALILAAQDKSIRTIEEAKDLFEVSLLGVIPNHITSKKTRRSNLRADSWLRHNSNQSVAAIFVQDNPNSPISAAYRMLQAQLMFLSANQDLKTIVVSSSVPKEGKSTVCANLAVTMARLGRKVLLVDADLYSPVQHQIWHLSHQVGLSNAVLNHTEFRIAIKEVMVNLDVLPSGVIPLDLMAVSDADRLASLIEKLSPNYDVILIDTPALTVAADALILGKMADGILLVVRPGVVDVASATLAKELLQKSGQSVLGQVVNRVIAKLETYNHYYLTNKFNMEEKPNESWSSMNNR